VNLIRLPRHQHPRPPHRELRQKRVLDSGYRSIGQVANLYVDDDMKLHFLDVAASGFLGLGTKHYLVPVEAIAEEAAGSITLEVDQQAVESAPTVANPRAGLDEELQRSTSEHYGY
jgi:PRC-barrel domain